ncbi:hypothetical protein Droror1_Dr00026941 [Drosera rotundifolia]
MGKGGGYGDGGGGEGEARAKEEKASVWASEEGNESRSEPSRSLLSNGCYEEDHIHTLLDVAMELRDRELLFQSVGAYVLDDVLECLLK